MICLMNVNVTRRTAMLVARGSAKVMMMKHDRWIHPFLEQHVNRESEMTRHQNVNQEFFFHQFVFLSVIAVDCFLSSDVR